MVVISERVMCCTECGGFNFLATQMDTVDGWTLTHPAGDIYTWFDKEAKRSRPCPNIGHRFKFPPESPTLGIRIGDVL
jgi:hypothetical protein